MPVCPLIRRPIVIQEFTQKSVLFAFYAEKIVLFPLQIPRPLHIYKFNLPNANYLSVFVIDSCFQKPQFRSEAPVFPLFIFTVNRQYSVLRSHSCYSCLFLYWQTSYTFTRFLLCVCFSLDVSIYKTDKGLVLRYYGLTRLLWRDLIKRDSLEALGVYERIILKWNFRKWYA